MAVMLYILYVFPIMSSLEFFLSVSMVLTMHCHLQPMTLDIFIFGVPLILAKSGKYSSQLILSELQVPTNDVTHYVNVKSNHPPSSRVGQVKPNPV